MSSCFHPSGRTRSAAGFHRQLIIPSRIDHIITHTEDSGRSVSTENSKVTLRCEWWSLYLRWLSGLKSMRQLPFFRRLVGSVGLGGFPFLSSTTPCL